MIKHKYIQYKSDYIKLIGGTVVDIQEVIKNNNQLRSRVKTDLTWLVSAEGGASPISEIVINDNDVKFIINNNTYIHIRPSYPLAPLLVNGDSIFDIWVVTKGFKNIIDIIYSVNKIKFLEIPKPNTIIPKVICEKLADSYISFDANIKLENYIDYEHIFEFLLNGDDPQVIASYITGGCKYINNCLQQFSVNNS